MAARFSLLLVLALGGCAIQPPFLPDERPPPVAQEAPTVETGSRIPRGKSEAVRDPTQPVDVYGRHDIDKEKPAHVRDAVRRAMRGR